MSGPVEVTCDESGSEGDKLIGGCTDVFCHASIRVTTAEAAACVAELRAMIQSPASQYKAGHLLRTKNRSALEWFLGQDGPIHGRANAYLVDKTYLLLLRLAAAVGEGETTAAALYRANRAAWTPFLVLVNGVMRGGPAGEAASTGDLVALARTLAADEPPGAARDVLTRLAEHPADVDALLRPPTRPDPMGRLALDQLFPAILRHVDHWSAGGDPVALVHDTQRSLTDARMAELLALRRGRLAWVRSARAEADPRVQVADFIAGITRKATSDALAGTPDEALLALLCDYVDPRSLWWHRTFAPLPT